VSTLNASPPARRPDGLHGMAPDQIDSEHLNTESCEEQKKKKAEKYGSEAERVVAMLAEPG